MNRFNARSPTAKPWCAMAASTLGLVLMPASAHAVALTCGMGTNQYYPDNNAAFKTVILDTTAKTVSDGNGSHIATVAVSDVKYEFSYALPPRTYVYIVSRTTGGMNLVHRWSVDAGPGRPPLVNGGANYTCEVAAKPKF